MAANDATIFPVRGQAFRFLDVIKSSATGNPITGGLTSLGMTISKDGGAFGAAVGAVTEVSGTPGWVTIDLTAVDMDAGTIAYQVSASNSNAVYATGEIKTCDLEEGAGRADGESVLKLEQYLRQMWAQLFNRHTVNRETGAYTVYQSDDATEAVSGLASDNGTLGSRGKLS
jgi:hypothetical protein